MTISVVYPVLIFRFELGLAGSDRLVARPYRHGERVTDRLTRGASFFGEGVMRTGEKPSTRRKGGSGGRYRNTCCADVGNPVSLQHATSPPFTPFLRVEGFGLCRQREWLAPTLSAKLDDLAPITLRRSTARRGSEMHHGSTLFSRLLSQYAAGVSLFVERLRNRCRTSHLADQEHFHFKIVSLGADLQGIAHSHFASRFIRLL